MRNPVCPSSCVTPADTSNELDVQNEWEENTHQVINRYYRYRRSRTTVLYVVDSHIQRIVLATEETTVTQQVVSHRPIKCQSRLWSQRGTEVNGSHHNGDNPLLRPTGIQIATKSCAALQAIMAPTNIKTVHQTSLLHIESSNLDRLGNTVLVEGNKLPMCKKNKTYLLPNKKGSWCRLYSK